MKKFLTLITGVLLASSLTAFASAQAAGPAGGGIQTAGAPGAHKKGAAHAPIGGKMLKQLNLTLDQQNQIKALVKSFVSKRQQEQQSAVKPNRKELAQERKQFMEDLNKILTPDQQAKLKQLIQEQRANRKNKLGAKPGTGTTGTGTTGTGTTSTGGGTKTGGGN